jgi:hypothetical protein
MNTSEWWLVLTFGAAFLTIFAVLPLLIKILLEGRSKSRHRPNP